MDIFAIASGTGNSCIEEEAYRHFSHLDTKHGV